MKFRNRKTTINSKLPTNYFEPVGIGGWSPISTWIRGGIRIEWVLGHRHWWQVCEVMARGAGKEQRGSRKDKRGGNGLASSTRVKKVGTRVEYEVVIVECQFEDKVSAKAKAAVEEVEVVMVVKREKNVNSQILEEAREWVEDPIHSIIGDAKYFRLTETYWFVKTMVAQALVNVKVEHQDILHSLGIFEGVFEVVCGVVFGVKIIIKKAPEEEDKGKREMGSTSTTDI
jgi:hypothetical protein